MVKISSLSSALSIKTSKLNQGNNSIADDKQTIPKDDIVCRQSHSEQELQSLADDTDDKRTSYSNSLVVGAFQVGDRVNYISGIMKHKNKVGTIIAVLNDRYRCYWDGEKAVTEYLSCEEITK